VEDIITGGIGVADDIPSIAAAGLVAAKILSVI
jgi:hypothetical protein